jgi:hypothetical protein
MANKKDNQEKKIEVKDIPAYVQRMIDEGKALRSKMYALNGYMQSVAGQALPAEKLQLMSKQFKLMSQYSDVLDERISIELK